MWADNFWTMSHSKKKLEQDEGSDWGGEMGPGAETCKFVVDKHLCLRGGNYDLYLNGITQNTSR